MKYKHLLEIKPNGKTFRMEKKNENENVDNNNNNNARNGVNISCGTTQNEIYTINVPGTDKKVF